MSRKKTRPSIRMCINLATAMANQVPVSELHVAVGTTKYLLKSMFSESIDGYDSLRKKVIKKGRGRKMDTSRDVNICNMYKSGMTLGEIGKNYGVCRERIRQILSRYGINRNHGGQHKRHLENKKIIEKEKKETSDKIKKEHLGCDLNEWKYYRSFDEDYYKTPIHVFITQRYNARRRDIEWKMTITEWWSVWEKSGKWSERGISGESYVMARHGDLGAYKLGNVKIITKRENSKEYYDLHMDEWRQKMIDTHDWSK